ncbi:hypothetical protein VTO42DRAFT_917 [Malbranchea cinnamomea]
MAAAARKHPRDTGAPDDSGVISGKDNSDRVASKPNLNVLQPSANGALSSQSRHPSSGRPTPPSSNSAASSREVSPIRPLFRSMNSSTTSRSASLSRKNSEDSNLSRQPSDISINNPSTLQRKLSNVNKPHLPPPSTENSYSDNLPTKKPAMPPKPGEATLQWPISPRLRSPPPPSPSPRGSLSRTSSPKPPEPEVPLANTSLKRQPNPLPLGDVGHPPAKQDGDVDDTRSRPTPRTLTRGAPGGAPVLETVQEAGTPVAETPPPNPLGSGSETSTPKATKPNLESGSDSGGNNGKVKDTQTKSGNKQTQPTSSHKPGDIIAKRSYSTLNAARAKPGESSMKNMIVETETVSSVPQLALGVGAADRTGAGRKDSGSNLRLKASDETIRPKKEKKKQSRKTTTIPSGTASSKADIFEAKVASAVDDADTSDSDETFVYESNPDTYPQRHRYHSRTPSVTSMASQMDQYGGRVRGPGMREMSQRITGKRSMKFTNNTYSSIDDHGDDLSVGRGSSRTTRHYHSGRPGRNGAHLSLLDPSQFTTGNGSRSPRHLYSSGTRHSRSGSPRVPHHYRSHGTFKNDDDAYSYDYDAEGADDERTPLVGLGRNRSRHSRRPNGASLRQMEYHARRRRGWFARYGFCILLLILFFALVGGATTFIIGISKSMINIQIREIQNVLASEQELMLDLDVEAINPNLIPITISDMDVNIFARSRFVGGDGFWRVHGPHPDPLPRNTDSRRRAVMARAVRGESMPNPAATPAKSDVVASGGIDKGTDPMPEDPAGDPQTMLLGRIFHFSSPLTFEASPWKHEPSHSIGQVRLMKPGNRTEEGGSARWERVLQHPFDLIVRGIVKYQLPLGSRAHSASISSSIRVLPDNDTVDGDQPDGVPPPPVDDDDLDLYSGFHTTTG